MVLEMKAPEGSSWEALRPIVPVFLTYVLSFVFLGIYWNTHRHLLHAAETINSVRHTCDERDTSTSRACNDPRRPTLAGYVEFPIRCAR